jgi:hypothetical protein
VKFMQRALKYTDFVELIYALLRVQYTSPTVAFPEVTRLWNPCKTLNVQTDAKGPGKLCGKMQQIKLIYSHMEKLPLIMLKHRLNFFFSDLLPSSLWSVNLSGQEHFCLHISFQRPV